MLGPLAVDLSIESFPTLGNVFGTLLNWGGVEFAWSLERDVSWSSQEIENWKTYHVRIASTERCTTPVRVVRPRLPMLFVMRDNGSGLVTLLLDALLDAEYGTWATIDLHEIQGKRVDHRSKGRQA